MILTFSSFLSFHYFFPFSPPFLAFPTLPFPFFFLVPPFPCFCIVFRLFASCFFSPGFPTSYSSPPFLFFPSFSTFPVFFWFPFLFVHHFFRFLSLSSFSSPSSFPLFHFFLKVSFYHILPVSWLASRWRQRLSSLIFFLGGGVKFTVGNMHLVSKLHSAFRCQIIGQLSNQTFTCSFP